MFSWLWYYSFFWIFFFQAEDGIRHKLVTGVQTCALPISAADAPAEPDLLARARKHPELQSLQAHEAAARARADEERIAIRPLPTVSLIAERITSATPPYWGLRTGVAFDVPLLSWNRGRVHEQEENARTAAVQAQAAMQRLTGQILAARERWAGASARVR